MKYPNTILMIQPNNFRIAYEINDHMKLDNTIDNSLALEQWKALKNTYLRLGFKVITKVDNESLPDMVFCANPAFTLPGKLILSNMNHRERQPEPKFYEKWFSNLEVNTVHSTFEGMGDLLINYPTEKFYGGFGFRTSLQAYDEIEKIIDYKVIRLKLISSKYYHLDTCLCVINKDTALYVESAFNTESLQQIIKDFSNPIKVDETEALQYLACNAHSPDGKHVLVEKNAIKLQQQLNEQDFKCIPLDTSEFLKSGGSIFCMKNQGWFN